MTLPIWVFAVAAGILISAYMAVKTGKEERQLEMESIEREGEIYIKRLEREREERQKSFGS
ncbi:sporulation YhaL family protein [Bacillus sp. T33-2]|uniref:sporulation YhaL family protein n=1 Tax=Bacillus sp. T33-2 TaxID=2054168 RepID=UPI000C789C8B|nr:sporulation YhaL family protein [Bacillus sp. T33-2]PLR89951.1 SigE-dependent sporulation protein [Bacillus sp. T33-2]